jgi:hypothetical protein
MKSLCVLCVVTLALCLIGTTRALAQDVRYNFDKSANFGTFKTYKWVPIKGAQPLNELTDRQIKMSIDAELAKKGSCSPRKTPPTCTSDIRRRLAPRRNTHRSTRAGATVRGGTAAAGTDRAEAPRPARPRRSTSGQLALDMYDPAKKALVWRGAASKTLDEKAKPEKQQKNLDKAVTKLLKNYPPPPPKK